MDLNNESKTLFIPLLGKAQMSQKNLFLKDLKAEEIVSKINYDFKDLKVSKWLSMYLSVRALIIDELCEEYLSNNPNTTVIHLGCGLDSRCLRIKQNFQKWYDIDYENVIDIRKKFYDDTSLYKMIGSSISDYKWIEEIDAKTKILVVMEGLTMYLTEEEMKELLLQLNKNFTNVHLLLDAYSKKAVKYSKKKNPVNQVNAKIKYGFDNSDEFLHLNYNLTHISTHLIKKDNNNLPFVTKFIFNNLYCGKFSQSLYKIYEFKLKDM